MRKKVFATVSLVLLVGSSIALGVESEPALGGYCPVCKIEMGKDVKGTADFAVDRKGERYLFPGEKQLHMPLAHPTKYATE